MRRLPSFLSSDAQDFIMKMLTYEPARRPSAEELLAHNWIRRLSTVEVRSLPANNAQITAARNGTKSSPYLPQLPSIGGAGGYTPPNRDGLARVLPAKAASARHASGGKTSGHLPMLGDSVSDTGSPKIKALVPSDEPPTVATDQLHERGPGTSKSKVGHIFNKNKYTTSGAMDIHNSASGKGRVS